MDLLVDSINGTYLGENSHKSLLPHLKKLSEVMNAGVAQFEKESFWVKFFHREALRQHAEAADRLACLVESLEDSQNPAFWEYVREIVSEADPAHAK